MAQGYEMHVISNTHWDREWLYNFQETRMFLVEFMDKLLDILDTEPEYGSYLMDSQVIPVEDYLEARPEKRELVERFVKEDRIQIGPWYTLPEEFNVSGESLVRNLIWGHKKARAYGGVTKTGYSPFSYGQNSQMAQLYRGFGIDTILFYHGIQPEETKSEFILEAPDGSWVYGSRMGSAARYNYYYGAWRPAVYGMATADRSYSWTEGGGMPFHMAGANRHMSHHFLLDVKKEIDDTNLKAGLDGLKKAELEHTRTKVLAYMQGLDSTEPDRLEVDIIRKSRDLIDADDTIIHSSLTKYLEKMKEAVKDQDLTHLVGERRTPRHLGHKVHLYGDVSSSRSRMKQWNTRAEYALQRLAEPFAVAANMLGVEYPQTLLDLGWKNLLQCHPHDSIAGAGVDQIEKDVMNRLDQAKNISETIMRRSMGDIQLQIDNSGISDKEIILTVFNPSPFVRDEIVTAHVDLPNELEYDFYKLYEAASGNPVDHQEGSRARNMAVVRHLGDATLSMDSEQLKLIFHAENIPAVGYKTFVLRKEEDPTGTLGEILAGQRKLENEHLIVEVASDGTLCVTEKSTGNVYDGLNEFEDNGEAGHPWRHVSPALDEVISSRGGPHTVAMVEHGPLSAALRIEYRMDIPVRLDEGQSDTVRRLDANGDAAGRTPERREMVVTSTVKLTRGAKSVEVKTEFDNTCKDHRLRVTFPTGLSKATHSSAETPYDVVDRDIDRPEGSPWALSPNPTHPMGRFVDVSDGANGMAIINDGLREYEVTDTDERRIKVTLMRAFQVELTTVSWRWERHPQMELSQSPGKHSFTYRILPHSGRWCDARTFAESDRLNLPLEIAQTSSHGGHLPQELSFFSVGPIDLVLSGIKTAENGDGVVVRCFNPTDTERTGKLTFCGKIARAELIRLDEEEVLATLEANDGVVEFPAEARKIITLRIVPA
jgi:mannosylglycerate hydrolase